MKKMRFFMLALAVMLTFCLATVAWAEPSDTDEPTVTDSAVADDEKTDDKEADDKEADDEKADDKEADDEAATDVEASSDAVGSTESAELAASETAEAAEAEADEEEEEEGFGFILINEIMELGFTDWMLIIGVLMVVIITAAVIISIKGKREPKSDNPEQKPVTAKTEQSREMKILRSVVFGALCISTAFVLSYFKIFSLPYGGSITLCSMLPIMLYASWVGPKYGFLAAFAYGWLQVIQGAYVVHPVQFVLDYILAFTALGLASLFRTKTLRPIGILVAGLARMAFSVVSGVVFFSDAINMAAFEYSLVYNLVTIGADTLICFIVYIIPPVRKALDRLSDTAMGA